MICPKCKEKLSKNLNTYKCPNNHSFDISKYGYVNLLLSKTNCGDPAESIKARNNFLNKDYYKPLSQNIINIINNYKPDKILDCGCGTGYYSFPLSTQYNITGIDISKDAILYASKKDKNSNYIVASSASIPFENDYFDLSYIIFAPLFEDELSRVLKEKGILILITPNTNHLFELKKTIYDNPYLNNPEDLNLKHFKKLDSYELNYKINLDNESLQDLIAMTPYFYKTSKANLSRIDMIDNLDITIDFIITIYENIK